MKAVSAVTVCPRCGYANPPDADFCENPAPPGRKGPCGEYLRWDAESQRTTATPSTGAAAGASGVIEPDEPRGPEVRREARRLGVRVVLTPGPLTVEPGQEATCEIRVRNTGTIVDQFVLDVEGDAASWSVLDPPGLSLFPGADATTVLRFRPPRSSRVPAGPARFRLRAVSRTAPDVVGLAEGVIEVGPFVAFHARIVPQTSGGPQRGDHRLVVENQGNETVRVLLDASDPDELLAVSVDPPVLTVDPGGSAVAAVAALARRPVFGAAPQQRPFRVRAEGPAGHEVTVPALFVQEPVAERPPQQVPRPAARVPPVAAPAAPAKRGVGPVGCLLLGLLWTLLVIALLLLALLVYAAVALDESTRDADNIAAMAVLFAFVVLDWSLIRWIRRRARRPR